MTEIIDGTRTEMHICEQCAQEQGVAVKSQIPLKELLSNLLAVQPADEELSGLLDKDLSCPECGLTLEQFRKDGVLGCPHDYEVFEKVLVPLIEKAHSGKSLHRGKVPSKMPADKKKKLQLSNLRRQLAAAVQQEDYETAAKLRDKINKLE